MAKLSWLSARLPSPEVLPTPSFGLNRALNGGLYSGRIHVYWGPKASGKSTAALYQVAEAQRQGKICAYIDAEKTFNTEWAIKCGVDVDKLYLQQALSAEELAGLVCPALERGELDLVVVDSLSSLGFTSFFDKPDANPMGAYARASKFFTHKILNSLQWNQQIILIAHQAMDFSGHYAVNRAAIGNAIEHWAATIVMFRIGTGKTNLRADGARKVTWRVEKSKTSPYPIEGIYYFMQDEASIDYVAEIAEYAVEEKILSKGGAWLYYPNKDTCGENKWQGMDSFLSDLKGSGELLAALEKELLAHGVTTLEEEE